MSYHLSDPSGMSAVAYQPALLRCIQSLHTASSVYVLRTKFSKMLKEVRMGLEILTLSSTSHIFRQPLRLKLSIGINLLPLASLGFGFGLGRERGG